MTVLLWDKIFSQAGDEALTWVLLSSLILGVVESKMPWLPECRGRHSSVMVQKKMVRQMYFFALFLYVWVCDMGDTHRHCHCHRPRETPDERVIHGQPAEVRVPVALGVQAHRQPCRGDTHSERKRLGKC